MQRIASTIARGLAVAALPVLLAGCSGSSDDGSGGSGSGGSDSASGDSGAKASQSASPSLAPARFTRLPAPCGVLAKKTVKDLVPKAKDTSGDAGKSSDTDARASCSWNGLDDFQYRWLEVSFERTESVPGVGGAQDQAKGVYTRLKAASAVPEGLKKGETAAIRVVEGAGDEAQLVSAQVKKDGEDYRDVTVVALKGNVVVTVSYDAAGFETDKLPKAKGIEDGAVKAAKEALAAVK